ncbi:MAG: hypothetical protein K0R39_3725 [Symbiobacteriaceae bacterium]|jgi:hypothetical protein|nr:hypothetical protein [Symbiobacteriaceae bacterium]
MFTAYTPLDRCIGREITVRVGGEAHVGMLAGVYTMSGTSILVITPMHGAGTELHIPLPGAVVTVKPDQR